MYPDHLENNIHIGYPRRPAKPTNPNAPSNALLIVLIAIGSALAQQTPDSTTLNLGATVTQSDLQDRLLGTGHLKNTLVKTEVIDAADLLARHSLNLSDALECQIGLSAGTGCSMCGMKRVRINGMEAEYTTILVDGVPLHSTVSGYYGTDALVSAGVATIEIARGSGAALSSPEAIGGVINVVTRRPKDKSLWMDASIGENGHRNLAFVGTTLSEDKQWRLLAATQFSGQGQEDSDDNGVNEAPALENASAMVQASWLPSSHAQYDARLSRIQSVVFGGPVTDLRMWAYNTPVGDPIFEDGDVRNQYEGSPMSTLEAIETMRDEVMLRGTHQLSEPWVAVTTLSGAVQVQNSIYEGNDYYHEGQTVYGDQRFNYKGWNGHLVTFGLDAKYEGLRSQSVVYYDTLDLDKDDFDYHTGALFAQDVFDITPSLQWSLALRLDRIRVDWTDKGNGESEIDEWQFSPRSFLRWDYGAVWTSRVSAGVGYRAPLTFFESDHGILDEGFDVDIQELERSLNGGYSLSAIWPMANMTLSATSYLLQHRAYVETDGVARPTLRNSTEDYVISVVDGAFGVRPLPWLELGLTAEQHFLDETYKSTLAMAAIERRVTTEIDLDLGRWEISGFGTWIGPRDLVPYGYADRFERVNEAGEPSIAKSTEAPGYFTIDARIAYALGKNGNVYLGAKNLLDYTQAGEGESPLFYDAEGSYDVGHIWGPLRGRQVYAGVSAGW